MDRKFILAPFDVKADSEGKFTGRASVYGNRDYYGDVVERGAFTNTLRELGGEIVVLNQHKPDDPIGKAKLVDRADALWAEGHLVLDLQSAREAYVRLREGLCTGISIGYETIREKVVGNTRHLLEIRLMEISLVTFPANPAARVTNVKHPGADGEAGATELLRTIRRFRAELNDEYDMRSLQASLRRAQSRVERLTTLVS